MQHKKKFFEIFFFFSFFFDAGLYYAFSWLTLILECTSDWLCSRSSFLGLPSDYSHKSACSAHSAVPLLSKVLMINRDMMLNEYNYFWGTGGLLMAGWDLRESFTVPDSSSSMNVLCERFF